MLDLGIACALIVGIAIIWRLAHAARQVPRAARVATALARHLPAAGAHHPRERISR